MFYETLAIARDWSIILLALEAMVMAAIPLYLLWILTKWIRSWMPKVRPALRTVHAKVIRVSDIIDSILAKLRAPALWLEGAVAWYHGFRDALKRQFSF